MNFTDLYEREYRFVRDYARSKLASKGALRALGAPLSDPDDIAQEVFLKLFRAKGEEPTFSGDARSYLASCADNVVISHEAKAAAALRGRRKLQSFHLEDLATDGTPPLYVQQDAGRFRRKVERSTYINPRAPHGTMNGYTNYRCRCDACREARKLAALEQRGSLPRQRNHGTYSTYVREKCRCEECVTAARATWKRRYDAKTVAKGAA